MSPIFLNPRRSKSLLPSGGEPVRAQFQHPEDASFFSDPRRKDRFRDEVILVEGRMVQSDDFSEV